MSKHNITKLVRYDPNDVINRNIHREIIRQSLINESIKILIKVPDKLFVYVCAFDYGAIQTALHLLNPVASYPIPDPLYSSRFVDQNEYKYFALDINQLKDFDVLDELFVFAFSQAFSANEYNQYKDFQCPDMDVDSESPLALYYIFSSVDKLDAALSAQEFSVLHVKLSDLYILADPNNVIDIVKNYRSKELVQEKKQDQVDLSDSHLECLPSVSNAASDRWKELRKIYSDCLTKFCGEGFSDKSEDIEKFLSEKIVEFFDSEKIPDSQKLGVKAVNVWVSILKPDFDYQFSDELCIPQGFSRRFWIVHFISEYVIKLNESRENIFKVKPVLDPEKFEPFDCSDGIKMYKPLTVLKIKEIVYSINNPGSKLNSELSISVMIKSFPQLRYFPSITFNQEESKYIAAIIKP